MTREDNMNHIAWMEREEERGGESTTEILCGILGGMIFGAAMMAWICLGLQLDTAFGQMDKQEVSCSKR